MLRVIVVFYLPYAILAHCVSFALTVLRGFHAYTDEASCGIFDSGNIWSLLVHCDQNSLFGHWLFAISHIFYSDQFMCVLLLLLLGYLVGVCILLIGLLLLLIKVLSDTRPSYCSVVLVSLGIYLNL